MDFFFNGEGFVFDFESCNMWIRQSQGTQSSGQRVAGIGGEGGVALPQVPLLPVRHQPP